jgi:Flp pilus assembly protein TadD
MKPLVKILALAAAVTVAGPWPPLAASAGGSGGYAAKVPGPLDRARELLAAHQWPAALAELQRIDTPRDPDWNNLMGYASRMKEPPDFAAAEGYYQAALAINPKHKPTLEYLGELRLQQGNLPGAEAILERLRHASLFRSAEYKDLQKAIERYKAAGNTYVPGT